MFVPNKAKLEKVVSKDPGRAALTQVYLRVVEPATSTEPGRGYLEATDSYKLARVPVVLEEGDTEGFVPPETLAAARKADRLKPRISANGTVDVAGGASYPRPDLGTFPNVDQLIPDTLDEFSIGLNARFLHELAQGLGSEAVELRFCASGGPLDRPSNLRPMTVRPIYGDEPEAVGILMPVKVAGK